ncbi:hypothetical protein K438DRAFT_1968866 [Mycena galopus ATCC 62051]|nr:hypothetical protein K438DRAFT_1968866 [Mycena galopus ATCC 62051]
MAISDHNSSFNVKVELPTFSGFQAMGQDLHVGRAPRAKSSPTQLSWPPSSPVPAPGVSPASTIVSRCQTPDVSPALPRDGSPAVSYLLTPMPGGSPVYPMPPHPSSHLRAPRTPIPQPDTWEQDEEDECPADNEDFPHDNDQVECVDIEVTATRDDSKAEQHGMDDSGSSGSDWGQEHQEHKPDQQNQEDVGQRKPQKLSDSDNSVDSEDDDAQAKPAAQKKTNGKNAGKKAAGKPKEAGKRKTAAKPMNNTENDEGGGGHPHRFRLHHPHR